MYILKFTTTYGKSHELKDYPNKKLAEKHAQLLRLAGEIEEFEILFDSDVKVSDKNVSDTKMEIK